MGLFRRTATPAPEYRPWLHWALIVTRVVIGALFLVTGTLKIMTPLADFEAVIRTYQFLPVMFVPAFAVLLPITEVVAGACLLIGLFERYAAGVIALMTLSFIIAITAALLRDIPLTDCGCFGGFKFGDGPWDVLLRDWILMIPVVILILRPSRKYALDNIV